jgi:hypothetical protein
MDPAPLEPSPLVSTQVQFTWAKAHLSSVYDAVDDGHGARVLRRHKSRPLALVGAEDLEVLLAASHPFTTTVSSGDDGRIAVWLEEFAIYGRGDDLDAALDDLLDEVDIYLGEWEERLRHAPDHAQRAWWVRRMQLAVDRDGRRALLAPTRSTDSAARR